MSQEACRQRTTLPAPVWSEEDMRGERQPGTLGPLQVCCSTLSLTFRGEHGEPTRHEHLAKFLQKDGDNSSDA